MTAKHTPGPWRTFNGTDVFPDDGDTSGSKHIADCNMPSDGLLYVEKEANAKLIAAAPDMFDALSSLENDSGQMPDFMWQMVQAAVEKAGGKRKTHPRKKG